MNKVIQYMDNMYYQYIDIQAKKNKININIPISIPNTEIDNDTNIDNTVSCVEPLSDSDVKYSDDYIYRKSWNKLNSIHKIIKIKEFVNNLQSDDIEMKKNLKIKLVNMIKDKQLTKKNDINYDSTNGCVLSIPILQYTDNKYIIV